MIEIKSRYDDTKVIYRSETAETVKQAIEEAVKARANLAGADLAGAYLADAYLADAYLADAYLAGAYLAGAYLAGAYLAGANLTDAYLAGAYLARANLAGADLARAYLAGAYLARAYLADAYLARADLAGANLTDAYLAGANLAGANLAGAKGISDDIKAKSAKSPLDVPIIPKIHSTLLAAVTAQGHKLDMNQWHTCETTHCRAGWICTLAGEAGAKLEKEMGPAHAAAAIYRASDPGFRIPHWYATTERALEDIRKCAEREQATV